MTPIERAPVDEADWELLSGLVDDVDGWIRFPFFGFKEEYRAKAILSGDASAGLMAIFPLVNGEGEEITAQGYSVGGGWSVQNDGTSIVHPTRSGIIRNCMYGQLISIVIAELKVPMAKYGSPLRADTWHGLGFHWKLRKHKDLSGRDIDGLMPVEWLGEIEFSGTGSRPSATGSAGPASSPTTDKDSPLYQKLIALAQAMDLRGFQKAALKVAGVSDDPDLMSSVLDNSEAGFWAMNQEAAEG